ncbi:hypothetical protein EJ05DRAFT_446713 [Pseudovirgaria hyperparasitica]|uniref:Velvet domain-containing protein n=1 Tax=Pseudovirgaria hyperparasitica TaxID=470096 RepID=A0A6A6VT11_9PEZI|nr:uncharacterized protein EJ05DRAFT_446713 [Pseudovirgaria hyperparasitica]KAF2752411.1 hypothetical protein EJ05DRAFT_446713 [Pseudovirgaria hyperparasitica]
MNEPISTVTSVDGATSYMLSVLQQPKTSRACGYGEKAFEQRRPIDPPPIIELHIFDNYAQEETQVQVFGTFFLVATIESVSPYEKPAQSSNDELMIGISVSHMQCPSLGKSAFFVFPDLSVRRSGSYRLTFTLYSLFTDYLSALSGFFPILGV